MQENIFFIVICLFIIIITIIVFSFFIVGRQKHFERAPERRSRFK
jgi:uncharacterized membrane protein